MAKLYKALLVVWGTSPNTVTKAIEEAAEAARNSVANTDSSIVAFPFGGPEQIQRHEDDPHYKNLTLDRL